MFGQPDNRLVRPFLDPDFIRDILHIEGDIPGTTRRLPAGPEIPSIEGRNHGVGHIADIGKTLARVTPGGERRNITLVLERGGVLQQFNGVQFRDCYVLIRKGQDTGEISTDHSAARDPTMHSAIESGLIASGVLFISDYSCALSNKLLVAIVAMVLMVTSSAVAEEERTYRHGISFFHELKYPADFAHYDFVNPDAPKGGRLVQSTQSNFNTLSPVADSLGAPGLWRIYDTLIGGRRDELSAFYGRLTDGIWVSEDKRTIVFRIHPDARWNDGVRVTAQDIRFTVELYQSILSRQQFVAWVDRVDVLGEREVALRLGKPLALSNIISLSWIGILPAHYWQARDIEAVTLRPPVSSGPYRISEVKQGRHIVFSRDPEYWGRDIPVNKGRYNFDEIRYEVYRDTTVAREAFRKGLFDIWGEQDIRYWATAFDIPALHKGWLVMYDRKEGEEIGVGRVIALNSYRHKFKDPRVREALYLAMDFDWQNRVLHFNEQERATSYFSGSSLEADGLPSEDELALLTPFRDQLPARLFNQPFAAPRSNASGNNRSSLLEARKLLADAGWRIRDGLLINAMNEEFVIKFLSTSSDNQRTLLPYIATLELLGIQGKFLLVDAPQYIQLRNEFNYDAILRSEHGIYLPPITELFTYFHSDAAVLPTSRNLARIEHPAVDALIDAAVGATTFKELETACRALDRVLLWGFYQIPLEAIAPFRTVYWNKFGRPEKEDLAIYRSPFPDGWWYDENKAAKIGAIH